MLSAGYITAALSRYRPTAVVPTLIAHAVQNPGNFVNPVTIGSTDTSGANFIVVVASGYDGGIGDNQTPYLFADKVGGTVSSTLFSATSITQSGSNMILNGTFASGGSNAYAGQVFFVTINGINSNPEGNVGSFLCTASTTTTITLTNPNGFTDVSFSYKAIITQNYWHPLTRVETYGNVCMYYCYNATTGPGHTFIMDTINFGGDGGAFAIQAWSGIKSVSDPMVAGSYLFSDKGGSPTTGSAGDINSASLSGGNLSIGGVFQLYDTPSLIGQTVTLSGFTGLSAANNGDWVVTSGNSSTLVLSVPGGYNGIAGSPKLKIHAPTINSLVISGLGGRNTYGARSIGDGFTITDSYSGGTQFASASMAYKLSTGANGESPNWTVATSSIDMCMTHIIFEHA